jgi:hypothetical protein
MLLVLLAAAAVVNLAAQWPGGITAVETAMGRLGLVDAHRLAEQSYRQLWSGSVEGQASAVSEAECALVADMASPYRWCDLGEALVEAGPEGMSKYCFRRAAELAPNAPHILLRAANGYFRLDDAMAALACTRRILAIVPVHDQIIFSTYARMGITIEEALKSGLPEGDVRASRAFLEWVIAQPSIEDARRVWLWAAPRGVINDFVADHYAAALVRERQYEAAIDSWSSYLGARNDRGANGLLFNGSFEREPLGETFDWRLLQFAGVEVERDPQVAYAGKASLRIHFDGRDNISYRHVRQDVVLPPGTYTLEARVRTNAITTDRGIALRICDALNEARFDARTADVVGTRDWTILRREVTIPPPVRLMAIQIVRDPSEKFDSAISGTAWVDDVKIVPQRR